MIPSFRAVIAVTNIVLLRHRCLGRLVLGRCDRFRRTTECPGTAEDDGASLRSSDGRILVVVFKEEQQIPLRKNEIGLTTDAVHGIIRNPARWHGKST